MKNITLVRDLPPEWEAAVNDPARTVLELTLFDTPTLTVEQNNQRFLRVAGTLVEKIENLGATFPSVSFLGAARLGETMPSMAFSAESNRDANRLHGLISGHFADHPCAGYDFRYRKIDNQNLPEIWARAVRGESGYHTVYSFCFPSKSVENNLAEFAKVLTAVGKMNLRAEFLGIHHPPTSVAPSIGFGLRTEDDERSLDSLLDERYGQNIWNCRRHLQIVGTRAPA